MHIVFTRSSTIYDDSRATKEIVAFLEAGYKVTVLGWDRNGKALGQCADLFSEYNNQISLRFFSGATGTNSIQKILSRLLWNKWLNKELLKENNIDVIHACDYDTGAAIRKFAQKRRIKYVYDIYDYYVDAHSVPSVLKTIIEKDEIKTIDNAEATIICTEERKSQIIKAHPKKVIVIHNSPEVSDYGESVEKYDYAYCGSLYDGRLIKEVLDTYKENHQYKFVFAGYGEYEAKAKELSVQYDEFTFLGSIPYSKVLEIEKSCKVLSALYIPTIKNHQLCAPNKFYEALALGKPIIVCEGTGIDKIVRKQEIGIVIDYSADSFYKAIKTLLSNDQIRAEMGKRGRELYKREYRWEIMKMRLLQEYKNFE